MNITRLVFIVTSCVVVHPSSNFYVQASNFNKPHSHTGKVEPFQPGDPNVKLDGKAKSILRSGKPYQVRCNISLLCISHARVKHRLILTPQNCN